MRERNATRQMLLDAGRTMVQVRGLRGFTVRELAKRTGVNLGSFVYHFGTRERFLAEVVEGWYAPIYARLRSAAAAPLLKGNTLERLRAMVLEMLELLDTDAEFVSHLAADAVAGEWAARDFLLRMPTRHPRLLLRLIAEGQKEGVIRPGAPMHLMAFVMAGVGFPLILARGPLKHVDWLQEVGAPLLEMLGDIACARQRLDWAIQGISLQRGNL